MGISHRVLCEIKFGCGGHLGRCSEMPDIILEEDHPRIIPVSKMATITKNRNFFKWPKLFYFKPESAQI
jgi:hypothetical protein